MIGALWTGISGMAGSQQALDNESNNIANVNTIGYKASRVSFADQMYQDKIGKGVTSFDVEKMYTQGNLKNTGVSYDMALSGDGFFQVKNGNETYYTRAGNFRMGENGKLEDVGQNQIQGWAMAPLTDEDITSTDSNSTYFTNDYTTLLGNKIIKDTTTIETITAKSTDYTKSASTDSLTTFTGAGYKTASTKIADVEQLITEYNTALSVYSEADPKPTASVSRNQQTELDFGLDLSPNGPLAQGDEIYAYIDGVKYSQSFDTDAETTFKKFADVLSNTPGFKAHEMDNTNDGTAASNYKDKYDIDTDTQTGQLFLESIIPGQQFRVTEIGWTDASNSNQATKGTVTTVQESVQGTGMGHIESVRDALAEAVSGKQESTYTLSKELGSLDGVKDYSYQINIYDKELDKNITVPTTALKITDPTSIDDFVNAIDGDPELSQYVKAYNINGNLVVKTLDRNNDVEFSEDMKITAYPSNRGGVGDGTAPAIFDSFSDTQQPVPDGQKDYLLAISTDGDGTAEYNITITDPKDIDAMVKAINDDNAANGNTHAIAQNVSGKLVIWPSKDDGAGNAVEDESVKTEDWKTALNVGDTSTGIFVSDGDLNLAKNPDYSGREGAAAEFLELKTTINQTASKGDIQLRLDTLRLTDSAFGDFNVDNSGLITMTQDGAQYAVGQVAVARFTDNRGLEAVGDNLLKETTRSGSAIFNIDNEKMAEIKGGTLELSTADLSESLVNLMVFQRAFEANAKSITTADQILTTLIGLKR